MSTHSILPHEFHTLSQQNTRLNQNLITITLNHEHLLQENQKLHEDLKKKDYALIESTLREKNLDHTLNNVKAQYTKLQDQYKEVHNWMRSEKKVEMRDIFKKESQLALDMVNIQSESYREANKAKNQQLNLYQNRIMDLLKENDNLKIKILEITSEYNSKIYDLKCTNLQNDYKIKALKDFETKTQKNSTLALSSSKNDIQNLQLQLKIQNLKEKMDFYRRENSEIKARNSELNRQIDQLLVELKEAEENTKEQSPQNQGLKFEKSSVEYITGVLEENTKLRKEIEETTNKFILLTETYPKLIQQFDTIRQLQENIEKFNQVKQIEQKLTQSEKKCTLLQQSLTTLQSKYLAELKTRQNLQQKSSILTKRFNQIFIKMNPYFDIYQYESLELDENMWQFFDQKKDYKSLKEYEGKVAGLKRELKEVEVMFERKERQMKMQLQEREREVERVRKEKQEAEVELKELTDSNKVLKNQLQNYQLSFNIQQQQRNPQSLSERKLQNQVTVPLLQTMISSLQLQRQELFKVIYQRDNTIGSLTQELHSTKLHQPIKTINLTQSQSSPSSYSVSSTVQFTELLRQNQELQEKYDQTVQKLSQELNALKQQLNHQHDAYQMEVKKYEHNYETTLEEMRKIVEKWVTESQELRKRLIVQEQNKLAEKQQNLANLQRANKEQQIQAVNQGESQMIEENLQPHKHKISQPSNLRNIFSQPSHTNFQNLPPSLSNQEGSSNKLIGQTTVQNLNQTLKKYEQEMTETYNMCAKLSQEYDELKNKLKQQEEMEKVNIQLSHECSYLREQLKQTQAILNEKNQTLTSLEQLYKAKTTEYDELKSNATSSQSFLESKLMAEKSLTQKLTSQLQQIKQKFYQLSTAPQPSSEQPSSLSNNEFQTIFVMQSSKHKEITQLSQKNKLLEGKMHLLMQELNEMKHKEVERKSKEASPLEREEMKQLTTLLQGTNVLELVKKANMIIEAQTIKDLKIAQQNQQEQQQQHQNQNQNQNQPMEEELQEGEQIDV